MKRTATGPVGQRRQDRVERAAPVVEGEELARAGPSRARRAAACGRGRGRRRATRRARRRAARAGGRGRRRAPAASTRPPRAPRRADERRRRAGAGAARCTASAPRPASPSATQRPRLVGRAQELHGLHVVVGEGRRAAQRRALGEAGDITSRPSEHQRQEERRVARAPRPGERAQAQRGDAPASPATTGASPRRRPRRPGRTRSVPV